MTAYPMTQDINTVHFSLFYNKFVLYEVCGDCHPVDVSQSSTC